MPKASIVSEEVWEKMRLEYISTDISLRGLEKKYGVPFSAIRKRYEREKWMDQRTDVDSQRTQKSIDLVSTHQAKECVKAFLVANKLLDKIEKAVDAIEDADTGSIKQLTGAIKDLKEIGVFRADLDRQEQMARIKKLQKDAEEEQKDATITVVFEDSMDEYGD
jgi:hypothetical protein